MISRSAKRTADRIVLSAFVVLVGFGLAACEADRASAGGQAGVDVSVGQEFGIVIHGGAGTILPENMTDEREREYRAKLEESLSAGYRVLDDGGSSLDAVVAAIQVMEDSPLFNSAKGAVFTNDGRNELDASIMDGRTRDAGAVAGVMRVRNPILAARAVMEQSPHVMLAREGADAFAEEQGLEMVEPEYFFTERRWESLERARGIEEQALRSDRESTDRPLTEAEKHGTVGAVALDREGNLAAGTSTGGMTNKRWGRIGDSPVIGAGTYADNESCAVSATGHGEYFIRNVVAHDICARMSYLEITLQEAADHVIMELLPTFDATGGVIAMDRDGNIAMPFNTAGMYRGYVGADGQTVVEIYGGESGD